MEIFTKSEIEFIKYSCSDDSYRDISIKLGLSRRTIDRRRDNVFKKLNIKSRHSLIMFAVNHDKLSRVISKDLYISKVLIDNKAKELPYSIVIPRLINTEEENAKKEFNVGDWQTMTDEQKQPYLKTELTFLKKAI